MVEHVSAGKEKDSNDADRGPDVAVLEHGQDVGSGGNGKGHDAQHSGYADNPTNPVDRSRDFGVRAIRSMAYQPGTNLFGFGGSVVRPWLARALIFPQGLDDASTYPLVKSYRTGSGAATAWGPLVGRK